MKKVTAVFLAIIIMLCFASCAAGKSKTPVDDLSEDELLLFDALKIITQDFYEPGAVRLLEVWEYNVFYQSFYGIWNPAPLENGEFHSVVVRLQGENRVGGTLNHYYIVRLDTLPDYIVDNVEQAIQNAAETACEKNWDNGLNTEYPHTSFRTRAEYKEFLTNVHYVDEFCTSEEAENQFGKCLELDDDYTISDDAEDIYNIAKINKALKYYWDGRLGNN